jgi:hypothetical protein
MVSAVFKEVTPRAHSERRLTPGSAWHVSGHAGRIPSSSDAMTAMLLAELEAAGEADGPMVAFYRQDLGLV